MRERFGTRSSRLEKGLPALRRQPFRHLKVAAGMLGTRARHARNIKNESLLPMWLQQRLGRLDLLRLLQSLLCHLVLPRLICPVGHPGRYMQSARQSPQPLCRHKNPSFIGLRAIPVISPCCRRCLGPLNSSSPVDNFNAMRWPRASRRIFPGLVNSQ